jgi:sulfur carrier protein
VRVLVNGDEREVERGVTVEGLVPDDTRGVAVAVDGEVVPRSEWGTIELRGGERVEILEATAGG